MAGYGASWTPGTDLAFVWDGGVLVVDIDADSPTYEAAVGRIWNSLAGQVSLGGVLQLLTEVLGSSLLNLPDFAVVLMDGDAGQIAARGKFRVVVTRISDTVSVDGLGVTTWSERAVDGIAAVSIGLPVDEGASSLPIGRGVVPSSRITWGAQTSGSLTNASRHVIAVTDLGEDRVPTTTPEVEPDPSSAEEPDAVSEIVAEAPITENDSVGAAESVATIVAEASGEIGTQTWTGEDNVLLEPSAVPAPSRYAAMWGDTVAHSIEEAAVRIEEEDGRPGRGTTTSVASADGYELISAVPGRDPGTVPAAPPVTEDWSDHDGATIVGFALAAPAPAPAVGTAEVDPQSVLALVCLKGHPNRPHVSRCRECGADLAGGITSTVPRPALGQIRASTGEQIPLTGPVLIGRSPRAARFQGSVAPRLLSLPYPHISSTHLEVRLEGWNVFAVDLDSMNGAYLRRRDEPPVRVTHTPLMLADEDVIDFGHGVSVTFEGMP